MFNIEAKIVQVLSERSGVSKQTGNPWVSHEYLGEYVDGDKTVRFVFTVFGDQMGTLVVGRSYVLGLKIEGREWQGKWFNNVLALQVYTSSMGGQAEEKKPMEPKPEATMDGEGKIHVKPQPQQEGKKKDASADEIPF